MSARADLTALHCLHQVFTCRKKGFVLLLSFIYLLLEACPGLLVVQTLVECIASKVRLSDVMTIRNNRLTDG